MPRKEEVSKLVADGEALARPKAQGAEEDRTLSFRGGGASCGDSMGTPYDWALDHPNAKLRAALEQCQQDLRRTLYDIVVEHELGQCIRR